MPGEVHPEVVAGLLLGVVAVHPTMVPVETALCK
jgi:hypothetical protein